MKIPVKKVCIIAVPTALFLLLVFAFVYYIGVQVSYLSKAYVEVRSEKQSPDGRYIATAFLIDCGATTSNASIVAVRRSGHKFDDMKGRVYVLGGDQTLSFSWVDKSRLRITPGIGRPFKQETKFENVTVEY